MRPGLVASRSGNRMAGTVGCGGRARQPLADERGYDPRRPPCSLAARPPPERPEGGTTMSLERVDIAESFARFSEQWSPKIVGELNGQMVKLVRFQGEFVWHRHEREDEMFLVVAGEFRMELRDGTIDLKPGQFLIVPRGVEHRPVAEREAQVMLFEPATTLNTGDVRNERTLERLERL